MFNPAYEIGRMAGEQAMHNTTGAEILKNAAEISKNSMRLPGFAWINRIAFDRFAGREQQLAANLNTQVQQQAERQGHGKKKLLIGAIIGTAAVVGGTLVLRDPEIGAKIGTLAEKAGPWGKKAFDVADKFADNSAFGNAVGRGAEAVGKAAVKVGSAGKEFLGRKAPAIGETAASVGIGKAVASSAETVPAAVTAAGGLGEKALGAFGAAVPVLGQLRTAEMAGQVLRRVPVAREVITKADQVVSMGPQLLANLPALMATLNPEVRPQGIQQQP
ncbi:hypothetical protein A2Z33_03585 [Candidatus Gottesmanbacteria bacterium RBG_16_52_11]|uniref:Uncharacterized protein n=1 Tax=Candidatus Gottesmanbacteria bacterium RBG_16_52_11 TaxID=1798374 RepID=A0A1F5YVK1_9BACT|nr:MAG: hypothetical protein A2Z33_03585 [Candidatus Gottesmanbacteria bacterium RBG_16_52_11]